MLGADPEAGSAVLHLGVAAGSAALFAVLVVAACVLSPAKAVAASRAGLATVGALLGAAMAWAFLGGAGPNDRSTELKARAAELRAQTLVPGSPLACLDALVDENLAVGCEAALFASPASVASALSYVAARAALFADAMAYRGRRRGAIKEMLLPLGRSLEADRFGLLAHVLATRDGCTSRKCNLLALMHNPSRVRANLSAEPFSRYLEYYLPVWAKTPDTLRADARLLESVAQRPHRVNIDFPSAASIPRVSIMKPEPTGPVMPGAAAAAAANRDPHPAAAPSPRRYTPVGNPAVSRAVQSASPTPPTAVEPIWPEPVPSPTAQSAPAPGAAAPAQPLSSAISPQASAGVLAHSP